MKTSALKSVIKEAVREAIQEELKDIILEAVRTPKVITQSFQPQAGMDVANGTLPPGEVDMNQIMGLMSK